MPIPQNVRVEAKFTTGRTVSIPAREREALSVVDKGSIGVVAVMFWCGERSVDGRWLLVDSKDSFGMSRKGSVSATMRDLSRRERSQDWLDDLRRHVNATWRPFLNAFLSLALDGHEHLLNELKRLHRNHELSGKLSTDSILDVDHNNAINSVIEKYGESGAGRIFQDLLAYVLATAGYATVHINLKTAVTPPPWRVMPADFV